jgi:hypothetical protein
VIGESRRGPRWRIPRQRAGVKADMPNYGTPATRTGTQYHSPPIARTLELLWVALSEAHRRLQHDFAERAEAGRRRWPSTGTSAPWKSLPAWTTRRLAPSGTSARDSAGPGPPLWVVDPDVRTLRGVTSHSASGDLVFLCCPHRTTGRTQARDHGATWLTSTALCRNLVAS